MLKKSVAWSRHTARRSDGKEATWRLGWLVLGMMASCGASHAGGVSGPSGSGQGAYEDHHYYYADLAGQDFVVTLTPNMMRVGPVWNPDTSPNPPVSAAQAIAKSKECIRKFAPGLLAGPLENQPVQHEYWNLKGAFLSRESGGWAWEVRYKYETDGPYTGPGIFMACWVLMDGTLLEPIPAPDARHQ